MRTFKQCCSSETTRV